MKKYIIEYGYSSKEPSQFTELLASNLESAKALFREMHPIEISNPYGPGKPKTNNILRIWNIKEKVEPKQENPKKQYQKDIDEANKSLKALTKAKKYAEVKTKKHAKDKIWHEKHPNGRKKKLEE